MLDILKNFITIYINETSTHLKMAPKNASEFSTTGKRTDLKVLKIRILNRDLRYKSTFLGSGRARRITKIMTLWPRASRHSFYKWFIGTGKVARPLSSVVLHAL